MNVVLFQLTKSQIKFIGGSYLRIQNIKLPNNKKQEVVVYSGDETLYRGQCTWLKTIIMHECTFENMRLFNNIFTHEMAHKQQWWSLFFLPLASLAVAGLFVWFVALASLFQLVVSHNILNVAGLLIDLLFGTILIAIPCAFSWLMEIDADFHVIAAFGLEEFLDVRNNVRTRSTHKSSAISRIIVKMTHPTTSITAFFWKLFHRNRMG